MYQEQKEVKAQSRYSEEIDALVEVTQELPQVKLELVHLFSVGYYARVLRIPAGTLVVAKLHKTRHVASLVKGTMRILEGDKVSEISAPHQHMSKVGAQRVGFAVTDCEYMTVHRTTKTTLAEIEAEVIAKSQEELCLGQSPQQ